MSLPPFPVDDSTLDLLEKALNIEEGSDRTTLYDLLAFYSQMGGSDLFAVEEQLGMRDPQYHVNDVIEALIAEVRRLRGRQ